jgi:hypothetical protein
MYIPSELNLPVSSSISCSGSNPYSSAIAAEFSSVKTTTLKFSLFSSESSY